MTTVVALVTGVYLSYYRSLARNVFLPCFYWVYNFKLGTFHEPKLARPLTIIPFSTIHDSSLFNIRSDKNNIALTKTESRIGHA